MNHRLSLAEFVVTIAIVIGVAAICFNYLQIELVTLITQVFDSLPREFRP